ncbi:hypothetical protein [Actinoplanes sp. NPDC051859]|uniref:hypothetical protein n=1 Tax=Actinoplanes sp. NPDC051859 TaxID=3363909 RepID=UPI003794CC23
MSTTMDEMQTAAFEDWLSHGPGQPRIRGRRRVSAADAGLRFAFYGRTSTGRFQDLASSREWQRENADRTIAGRGHIVAEFFDVGYSRSLPWRRRPPRCCARWPTRNAASTPW